MSELDPRIRIRAPLRCDGIGRLDWAEDIVSGGRLAVRWLPLAANGEAAIRACERIPQHPTLPRIFQTGKVGSSAYVALDFPEGKTLSAVSQDAMGPDVLLDLAAQLSSALAALHERGVVHGELSQDSVLLVQGGKAWLWDIQFIVANRLSDRRGENRLMQILVKSAPYLAPERAAGGGATQAADVYALGSLLCISGGAVLPNGATTLAVIHQIASGDWRPQVPPQLPSSAKAMIERMLARDPSLRPTAHEAALLFGPPSEMGNEAASETELGLVEAHTLDEVMEDWAEGVRIPSVEFKAMEAEAAAPPPFMPATSVALTDNLEVSPELAAGAVTLTAEEVAAASRKQSRLRRGVAVLLVLVALSALGLAGWWWSGPPHRHLDERSSETVPGEAVNLERPSDSAELDELSPLTRLKQGAVKAIMTKPTLAPVKPIELSRDEPITATKLEDEPTEHPVSDVGTGELPSASELKRPPTEM